ncbi:hypothetical protein HEO09_024485 [Escherichia coli]|nr:hypothetical protein [Escherichia coli]MBB8213210.1 hypothetical protein [Escherichia coli]
MIKQEILRLKMAVPGTFHGKSLRPGSALDKRVGNLSAKGDSPTEFFSAIACIFGFGSATFKRKKPLIVLHPFCWTMKWNSP